jgi:hypothetical protein
MLADAVTAMRADSISATRRPAIAESQPFCDVRRKPSFSGRNRTAQKKHIDERRANPMSTRHGTGSSLPATRLRQTSGEIPHDVRSTGRNGLTVA